jgi:adenylosuccinate lyase
MALHALSPLDGRYETETSPLREFFSEFAFMRTRARLELDYLSALSKTGVFPAGSLSGWKPDLQDFNDDDACKIQEYEKITRHDVKAIEYFLREKVPAELHHWIHFGLTSEDVGNIAQAIALKDSRDQVLRRRGQPDRLLA